MEIGDRFDNFGEIWEITKIRRRRNEDRRVFEIVAKNEWKDSFGKTSARYQIFHPRDLESMRKVQRDVATTRRRTKPTATQQAFISSKIPILVDEGYPQAQAIAIAYRMAGVPPRRPSGRRRTRSRARQS